MGHNSPHNTILDLSLWPGLLPAQQLSSKREHPQQVLREREVEAPSLFYCILFVQSESQGRGPHEGVNTRGRMGANFGDQLPLLHGKLTRLLNPRRKHLLFPVCVHPG